MLQVLNRLWRDERGLVLSSELMFLTCIVAIGMIVGLSAYRDGVVEELADTGRAVGQVNQSYSVAVSANVPAGITVAANVVTVTKTYGDVEVVTFNNYSYTDTADFGEAGTLNRVAGTNENAAPPPLVP